jgi:Rrf2 family protein
MIDLAEHVDQGAPVILRDVAERQGISKRYLEQLATNLRNAKLVTSSQGRGGGYALPRAPKDITIAEIIEASIGRINVVGCVDCPEVCPRADNCPSRDMWRRVNVSINLVLDNVTLDELCEGGDRSAGFDEMATPCSRPVGAQESA